MKNAKCKDAINRVSTADAGCTGNEECRDAIYRVSMRTRFARVMKNAKCKDAINRVSTADAVCTGNEECRDAIYRVFTADAGCTGNEECRDAIYRVSSTARRIKQWLKKNIAGFLEYLITNGPLKQHTWAFILFSIAGKNPVALLFPTPGEYGR
ncbi:MAG: hypothetical protein ABH844_06570 [Candidatus Omnitrophota bacterium]